MPADIRQGVLKAWDSANYLATVQLAGSLGQFVGQIPTARNIASGEMLVTRRVAVVFFDPSNPSDAVLFAVWT